MVTLYHHSTFLCFFVSFGSVYLIQHGRANIVGFAVFAHRAFFVARWYGIAAADGFLAALY
jgi:hypothetical protein